LATISIRIEETEKEALQEFAKEHDLSVSQVVRKAIKEFLKMNEIAAEESNDKTTN
jgi:predicted transcriptional regulator